MTKHLYFDNNATTPLADEVFEVMTPYLKECYGNPSSQHQLGRAPKKAMRDARRRVAALLGVSNENTICFTSGGTESNNTAIRSALAISGKKKVITTQIEHSSVLRLCMQLEKEGCEVHRLSIDKNGQVDLEELKAELNDDTAVVSVMMANNETGILLDIDGIGELVKASGAFFHVDAVQAVTKKAVSLENSPIDFLSLSAHKFYGPKGVGALYVRDGLDYQSLIWGGSQERGRRSGTENVAGIVGLGKAAELGVLGLEKDVEAIQLLRDRFEAYLLAHNPEIQVVGAEANRLGNTACVIIPGIDTEAFLANLDQRGICASSGSACMSGSSDPSHVTTAMGYSREEALSGIRFSFGKYTTREEIDESIKVIPEVLEQLKIVL